MPTDADESTETSQNNSTLRSRYGPGAGPVPPVEGAHLWRMPTSDGYGMAVPGPDEWWCEQCCGNNVPYIDPPDVNMTCGFCNRRLSLEERDILLRKRELAVRERELNSRLPEQPKAVQEPSGYPASQAHNVTAAANRPGHTGEPLPWCDFAETNELLRCSRTKFFILISEKKLQVAPEAPGRRTCVTRESVMAYRASVAVVPPEKKPKGRAPRRRPNPLPQSAVPDRDTLRAELDEQRKKLFK